MVGWAGGKKARVVVVLKNEKKRDIGASISSRLGLIIYVSYQYDKLYR